MGKQFDSKIYFTKHSRGVSLVWGNSLIIRYILQNIQEGYRWYGETV